MIKTLALAVTLCLAAAPGMTVVAFVGRSPSFVPTWDAQDLLSSSTWSRLSAKKETQSRQQGLGGGNNNKKKEQRDKATTTTTTTERFALGSDLVRLRADLHHLRENLQWAMALNDQVRVRDLEQAIRNGENRDPEIVYRLALEQVAIAKTRLDQSDAEKKEHLAKWKQEASTARYCLDRFQLEGLWVGNFGNELGQQLINVTYVGDSLVAHKVTGDGTVPRGKVSFTAQLAPLSVNATAAARTTTTNATALTIAESKANMNPSRRFTGQGHVAKTGFVDPKYVPGHMTVVSEDQFSFVWHPSRHSVHFERPAPEETLSLLRDVLSREDEVENMRVHLARCLDMDMTDSLARQHANQGSEPLRRISNHADLDRLQDGGVTTTTTKKKGRFNRARAFAFWPFWNLGE